VAAEVSGPFQSRRSDHKALTVVELGTHSLSVFPPTPILDANLFVVAASQLGPVALAAQSVCLVSASTSYQVPMSLSVATCVR